MEPLKGISIIRVPGPDCSQDICCVCSQDSCIVSSQDICIVSSQGICIEDICILSHLNDKNYDMRAAARMLWLVALRCERVQMSSMQMPWLLTMQMSWLLTMQMSWLQTQQMSWLQTSQSHHAPAAGPVILLQHH